MAPSVAPASKLRSQRSPRPAKIDLKYLQSFTDALLGDFVHAKRIESIANATTGVLHAASLALHAIGASYAVISGMQAKHGVKQVDRLLSNGKFFVSEYFAPWVQYVVADRKEIVVAMDWTEFDGDKISTLCIYLVTRHGRATPLLWKSVDKSSLKGQRNGYEDELVELLHGLLPDEIHITLLADRGFGDQKLYALLETLGWDYVIRFREGIAVEDASGKSAPAKAWIVGARPKMLVDAKVTEDRAAVPAVVVVHAAKMKEAWCLATSLKSNKASEVVKLYGRRFTIEETFRDQKDNHFGLGLSATHISDERRRDRLLFLAAIAHTLLTLLGAASEETGLDRTLKVNTSSKRTHSLFRQGLHWFQAMPNMRQEWYDRLIVSFDRIVANHAFCKEIFDII